MTVPAIIYIDKWGHHPMLLVGLDWWIEWCRLVEAGGTLIETINLPFRSCMDYAWNQEFEEYDYDLLVLVPSLVIPFSFILSRQNFLLRSLRFAITIGPTSWT
jgi:hypothetical protein